MVLGALVMATVLAGPGSASAGPKATPAEPVPWSGLLGSGLLTLPDTATIRPGRVAFALTIDNRDRDPLGLDIVDGAVTVRAGVTSWAEAYGQFVLNRSVAVPDTPVNPPPPLDQLVPPGATGARRPYYSLYSPSPYLDDTGLIRFGAGQPGDATIGLKARAVQPRGVRPGVAASLEVRFPLVTNLPDLQAGAGTGGIDLRAGAVAEWRFGRWSAVGSTGFMHVGRPAYPDQRIEAQGGTVVVTEEPLLLPYRLDLGLGLRRGLGKRFAAVAEATTLLETGRRTTSLDRARPVDLLLGLQFRRRSLQVTAALRDHRNALPSMQVRPSPLAGMVDLTRVRDEDLFAFLDGVDFGAAVPHLRQGSHRLLALPPGAPPLPAGARVIPEEYRIRSEHQLGFLVTIGLAF
jgi:hypothetical protein